MTNYRIVQSNPFHNYGTFKVLYKGEDPLEDFADPDPYPGFHDADPDPGTFRLLDLNFCFLKIVFESHFAGLIWVRKLMAYCKTKLLPLKALSSQKIFVLVIFSIL